jgi:2-polyprenyl-3-methyl-5-hydroxy-6-metoxy-1,4-benzoquinol methylase
MSSYQSTIIESGHENRDRELFNRIAANYLLKDILPANRVARKFRLEQTLKTISINAEISMLEVGCGAGFSAEYIRGQYDEYCGLDYSEELIRFAKAYHRSEKIEFFNANLKDFKTDRKFDVILLIGVLHHLKDSSAMMQYMVDLLKPGGWIVANEPQAGNPMIRLARALRKKTDPQYSSDQQEFKIVQLSEIFEQSGLTKIRIVPQGILSTPFAEVKMPFQNFTKLISTLACFIDKKVENNFRSLISYLTWNVIIGGQKTD